ncbi:MAG: leucine-rich repeat domain-containing protein [Eubacteriales bacterium]|nr:leucine-rich repeat domain-containing protein [Eubacteriales bacterium]
MASQKKYLRQLSSFRGIDSSSDPSKISDNRVCHAENMYRDYESGQGLSLETVPGFRKLCNLQGKIYGIFRYRSVSDGEGVDYIIVHAGSSLFRFPLSSKDSVSQSNLSPIATGIAERYSDAFLFDDCFYLLDGSNYFCMTPDGSVNKIGEDARVYVPTLTSNGEKYEQRNLLSNKIKDRYDITSAENECIGRDWLNFEILNPTEKTCSVYAKPVMGGRHIVIPPYAIIDNDYYKVTYIGDFGFENTNILTCIIPDTVTTIGYAAFRGCSSLSHISIPDSITDIQQDVFYKCTALSEVYLGHGLQNILARAFLDLSDNCSFYYNGTSEEFSNVFIAYKSEYFPYTVTYSTPQVWEYVSYMKISDICSSVDAVYINGSTIPSADSKQSTDIVYYDVNVDTETSRPLGIFVHSNDKKAIVGAEAVIHSTVSDVFSDGTNGSESSSSVSENVMSTETQTGMQNAAVTDKELIGFFTANPSYSGTAAEAIKGCTVCAVFDGRVFLTGNPKLPNTVFYSARTLSGHCDPTYIGEYNFFDDGSGNTPNTAMISTGSYLAVLKSDTVSDGCIYFHTPKSTGINLIPKIYPSTEGMSGVGCLCTAVNFLDDPVFVSKRGLDAIAKASTNLERSIEHRSSNIDSELLTENLSNIKAAEWKGYLCLLADGNIYLADSRCLFSHPSGGYQYEWFKLTDIGVYEGQTPVYHTLTEPEYDCGEYITVNSEQIPVKYDECEKRIEGEDDSLISVTAGDGENAFSAPFLITDTADGKYAVPCDTDGEMSGGVFAPACAISEIDGLLFFGCTDGSLCCFNTDKRGEDPSSPTEIPRKYYTFNGRRYRSICKTKLDDCGFPHKVKSTVPKSCVVKLKTLSGSRFGISVITDRAGERSLDYASSAVFDFSDTDFSSLSFSTHTNTIFPISEREKKWVEKQYVIYSEEYMRPFGIYGISYDFTVAGRIKNEY